VQEITDEYMLAMREKAKPYTLVVLKAGPERAKAGVESIIWEHGRRNHMLRQQGVLAIVCPVPDDSPLCGIGIFAASQDEVARIMDDDPGVRAGVFEYEIHPTLSFPGDQLPE
jgi:hypothetical protein